MSSPQFQQRLGLFDATMLVAGTMIGSGIFIVSADISRDVGSSGWLLLVWVLTGVMTIIGALSYAELAAMMPHAGGQYVYLREAYGPLSAFLYGWTFFVVIQTGTIAAVAVAFGKFLGVLIPELGPGNLLYEVKGLNIKWMVPVPWMSEPMKFFEMKDFTISAGQLVGVGVVAFLSLLNCRGVQTGKVVQNLFTVTKVFALALLIVLGLTLAVNSGAIEQNTADIWGGITQTDQFTEVSKFAPIAPMAIVLVVSGAMVGSLFSADAWNNVTFTAAEVRDPRRNLPWSLALGTGGVILLYILANVAYVADLPVRGDKLLAAKDSAQAAKLEARAAAGVAGLKIWEAEAIELDVEVITLQRQIDQQSPGTKAAGVATLEERIRLLKDRQRQLHNRANAQQTLIDEYLAKAAEKNEGAAFHRGIDHARDDRVGTAVLERIAPRFGVPIMAIAIMISTFGCLNGLILMGARLHYAMAQDRLFFASSGKLNSRGVPAIALILQGLWSIVLIFSGSYNDLLNYVIFAVLAFYALTVAGLFVLRQKMPNAERPYRAFGYPIIPALYVVLCTVISLALLVAKPVYSWPSFILVLTGIPVFFLWRGKAR